MEFVLAALGLLLLLTVIQLLFLHLARDLRCPKVVRFLLRHLCLAGTLIFVVLTPWAYSSSRGGWLDLSMLALAIFLGIAALFALAWGLALLLDRLLHRKGGGAP